MKIKLLTTTFLFVFIALGTIGGCGGGGGDGDVGPPTPSLGSVSGALSVGEGNVLDGDTNDPNDPVINNNTLDGQVVPVPVTIGGFASLPLGDQVDIYRVNILTQQL